jgi:hypothetical protein
MRKKLLLKLIVCIILVALIISGAAIYFSKPRIKWETYENKEFGYKLKYPTEWEIKESEMRTTDLIGLKESQVSFSYTPSAGEYLFFNITTWTFSLLNITVHEVGRTLHIAGFRLPICSKERGYLAKIIEDKNTSLGSLPARKTVYPATSPTGEQFADMGMHASKRNLTCNITYNINYFASLAIYNEYLDTANQIVNSFEFI